MANSVGKGQSFQQVVLAQMDVHTRKHEVGCLLHIKYKNELKMDHRPNVGAKTITFLEEK